MAIHDKNTKRVGNMNKSIKQSTLNDLKKVDVGCFKYKKWKGEQIPSLNELLQTIPSDGKLIIEIKSGKEIIEPLCLLIKTSGIPEWQIEFISFNRKVLTEIKIILPQYAVLWLLNLDYYLPTWLLFNTIQRTIRKVLKSNLDGVNVWVEKKINREFVHQFKQYDLLVYTWIVNDLNTASDLLKMGVDALTTDRAAWLTQQLIKHNPQ